MNNVDRPGGRGGQGAEFLTQNNLGRNLDEKRERETDLLDGALEFDEEPSEASAVGGRQADLLRSFRAAIRGFKDKNEEKEHDTNEQTQDLRTLAVAEQGLWTGLPLPAGSSSSKTEVLSSTDTAIASIMEVIDRSIKAEMSPSANAPLAIKIAFHDESLGLAGMQVVVTQTTLEVIFERTASPPSEELARAAQALAERLVTRFSKKTVRILDKTITDEQTDEKQLNAAISMPFKPFL
jgi:hypothetical protein